MIPSSTGIHYPFDVSFFPLKGRGGGGGGGAEDVPLVSRPQLCFHRKLIFCRANQQIDSALDGSFHGDHGETPVHVIENFPHLPYTNRPVPATPQRGRSDFKSLRAVLRVSVPGPSGTLPPHVLYLLELGFDLEQIKLIAGKYPPFANYSLEGNIRPLVEFLLNLGVSKSDLPKILIRRPQLCGMTLPKNLSPSLAFLETLGVDKSKWPKLISTWPVLLTTRPQKIEAIVEFFYEMGVSEESIGKILTRFPQITSSSVEDKLRPIAEYFLEKGFSTEEIETMVSKFGSLYKYSLKRNVVPKWEFFLTTDYQRQHLIKFPHYFSYSLEERIKPRYKLMKESGVKLSLNQLLSRDHHSFELSIKKKIEKLQLPCN